MVIITEGAFCNSLMYSVLLLETKSGPLVMSQPSCSDKQSYVVSKYVYCVCHSVSMCCVYADR